MVQPTENEGSNQQRGNKRQFSNTGDYNQGGSNPRGDHGGKFQRRSFGDRGPFNKGGDRPFNKDNNFNRGRNQNFGQGRDNQNFNRGRNNQNFEGRNNQNFRKNGFQNNRFNKSWEGNGNDNAADFEQNDSVTKHKEFDEENENEEASNTVNAHPKNKKSKKIKQNVEQKEVETSRRKNQKAKKNEEEETSSENEEDKVEANVSEEQMEIATNEDNTNTEKQNKKTEINSQKSRTVYVGSLPASVTEKKVTKLFKKYGKIECIKFRETQDEYAAANVIFEKLEDAEKAEEVNGMMYKDHRLSVFFCRGRRTKDKKTSVFVREIPSDFTLTDIWDAFESTYGPVRDIVLPISKTGHFRPTGYAFIDFHSVDSKELAIKDKQITIKDKIIKVAEFQEQEKGRKQ